MIRKWFKETYYYQGSHWLYGRCLGLITFIAFLSYWYQADALIWENGLSPWTKDQAKIEQWCTQNPDLNKWNIRPTLLWWEPLANHQILFVIGSVSSLFLTIGFFPFFSKSRGRRNINSSRSWSNSGLNQRFKNTREGCIPEVRHYIC